MTEIEPDRRTVIGPYYVDLWEGFFRDEVRVWKDVRPALGGLVARRVVRKKDSAAYYDEVVEYVTKGWLELLVELGVMTAPVDWDGESYCIVEGCGHPAVHKILTGMDDGGVVVYELVCCLHAVEGEVERRWTAEMWSRIGIAMGWRSRDGSKADFRLDRNLDPLRDPVDGQMEKRRRAGEDQ